MDNQEKKFTKKEETLKKFDELEKRRDEMSEDEYLREEEEISVSSIIEEITPLFKEFFVGEFIHVQNMILCTFYNGDKFKVSIEKVEDEI